MFRIYAKTPANILFVGHQGENIARCVCFDLTDMWNEFGIGTWAVVFKRPNETLPYLVQNTAEVEQYAVWGLDDTDTAKYGEGRCELRYYVDDVLCKTDVYAVRILPSLGVTGDIPDPYEDLLNNVHEDVQLAASSADRAAENADRAAGYIEGSDVTDAVRWDVSQFLSVSEQGRARGNINAANAIVESAEGSVASFADGAEEVPMASVVADIELIQSGTGEPSPDNVRPISGWDAVSVTRSGKNILPYPYVQESGTALGVTITVNDDGSVSMSGTPTGNFYRTLQGGFYVAAVELPSWLKRGQTYTISSGIDSPNGNKNVQIIFYDVNGNQLGLYRDADFTVPDGAVYYGVFVRILQAGGAIDETFHPMIRLASETDATWESYNAQTYTTTLDETRYGGTLDLVSGVLTVDKACETITSQATIDTVGSSGHGWYVSRASHTIPPLITDVSYADGVTCDRLISEVGASSVAKDIVFVNQIGQVRINTETVYSTKEDLLAALGDIQVCYPIEPTTVQLTPTEITSLFGDNVLWADSGDVSVTYRADLKTYIDNRIETLTNAIISLGGNV